MLGERAAELQEAAAAGGFVQDHAGMHERVARLLPMQEKKRQRLVQKGSKEKKQQSWNPPTAWPRGTPKGFSGRGLKLAVTSSFI